MRYLRNGWIALIGLSQLLGSFAVAAQTGPARLVKDINTTPIASSGSSPAGFVELGGVAFFKAYSPASGTELWKTDGTEAGTVLVKDIRPGPSGSLPTTFVRSPTGARGLLFFVANDGVHGDELWRSDGTEAGTVLLKDIWPGTAGSYVGGLIEVNGRVLFRAIDSTHGGELWRSDGTGAGTDLVIDLEPGPESSAPRILSRLGPFVYFTARFGNYPLYTVLLKSDGTAAGTSVVTELSRLYVSVATVYEGALYITARTYSSNIELWRSDGSGPGTVLVKEFPVVPHRGDVGGIAGFTEFNGELFFVVQDGNSESFELWKTQGTGPSTTRVKIFDAGGGGTRYYGLDLVEVNGSLVFMAFDDEHGFELWKSDGTEAGTILLKDIRPGSPYSLPFDFAELNGLVLFRADDGVHFTELWKSDGTERGTAWSRTSIRVRHPRTPAGP